MIKHVMKAFIGYVVKRSTGQFLDELFDYLLKRLVACTESKIDDELLELWLAKKEK
ncbi:MAG: hypothetical protein ACRCXT_05015 [Paraclostridium sp.]